MMKPVILSAPEFAFVLQDAFAQAGHPIRALLPPGAPVTASELLQLGRDLARLRTERTEGLLPVLETVAAAASASESVLVIGRSSDAHSRTSMVVPMPSGAAAFTIEGGVVEFIPPAADTLTRIVEASTSEVGAGDRIVVQIQRRGSAARGLAWTGGRTRSSDGSAWTDGPAVAVADVAAWVGVAVIGLLATRSIEGSPEELNGRNVHHG